MTTYRSQFIISSDRSFPASDGQYFAFGSIERVVVVLYIPASQNCQRLLQTFSVIARGNCIEEFSIASIYIAALQFR